MKNVFQKLKNKILKKQLLENYRERAVLADKYIKFYEKAISNLKEDARLLEDLKEFEIFHKELKAELNKAKLREEKYKKICQE